MGGQPERLGKWRRGGQNGSALSGGTPRCAMWGGSSKGRLCSVHWVGRSGPQPWKVLPDCEGAKHSHGWLIWDLICPGHSSVSTSRPGTPRKGTFGKDTNQYRYDKKYLRA